MSKVILFIQTLLSGLTHIGQIAPLEPLKRSVMV